MYEEQAFGFYIYKATEHTLHNIILVVIIDKNAGPPSYFRQYASCSVED